MQLHLQQQILYLVYLVPPKQAQQVTQARATTSRVTTNPRQELPHTLITGSTAAQAHAATSSVTTTSARSVPLDTESGPTGTQASQMPPQPPQRQVNTDHSSGLNGHIPDAGTCF